MVAERDAAVAEGDVLRAEIDAATTHASTLEATAAELRGELEALEAEKAWSVSSQEELEARVRESEQDRAEALAQKAAVEATLAELEERSFHEAETARVQARSEIADLEARLSAANAALQSQQAKAREQLGALQLRAEAAEQGRSFAQAELTGFRGQMEALTEEVARLHRELETTLASAGPEIVRGLRDQLVQANRRVAEAQTAVREKKVNGSGANDAEKAAWTAEREKFVTKLTMLETALDAQRRKPTAPPELIAERDKLRSDLAAMKKRLMAAENAIETAAMLKAKVAKLEAALKGKQ